MQRVPMTTAGAEALRKELDQLKKVDRPRISAAIAEAREHGDLKENAEYHAAREQQGFCEGRIQDIESKNGGKWRFEENTSKDGSWISRNQALFWSLIAGAVLCVVLTWAGALGSARWWTAGSRSRSSSLIAIVRLPPRSTCGTRERSEAKASG